MQWISVKDRLPKHDLPVLVHYAEFITKQDSEWEWTENACRYVVAKFSSELEEWIQENSDCQWDSIIAPTHWMPLPEPPKQ